MNLLDKISNPRIEMVLDKYDIQDKNIVSAIQEIALILSKDKDFAKNIAETNARQEKRKNRF